MPALTDDPSEAVLRREDDRRLASLEQQVALLNATQNTANVTLGEIKGTTNGISDKLDKLAERVINEHAEPQATPAGRLLMKSQAEQETEVAELARRVDALDDFRSEIRGAVRALSFFVGLASLLSAGAAVFTALHTVAH